MNWIVRTKYWDGVPAHEVIHRSDLSSIEQGMYAPGVVKGMSINRAEMQRLADTLNEQNEPAPDNPFRTFKGVK